MNDEIAMRFGDRFTYAEEQLETRFGGKLVLLAVLRDGQPLDVFHGQVRNSVRCGPSVEQPGNVGMRQSRQDLPLVTEPVGGPFGIDIAANEFECDALMELPVDSSGNVDRAHTT